MIQNLNKDELFYYNLKKKELMYNLKHYKNKYGNRYLNIIDNESYKYVKTLGLETNHRDDGCPCCGCGG
jgi:hypothetical protein